MNEDTAEDHPRFIMGDKISEITLNERMKEPIAGICQCGCREEMPTVTDAVGGGEDGV